MKIKIEIDCSPAEARQFFGLPDVQELQDAVMRSAKEKIVDGVSEMDVGQLAKMWFPAGMANMEKWQDMFWKMSNQETKDK